MSGHTTGPWRWSAIQTRTTNWRYQVMAGGKIVASYHRPSSDQDAEANARLMGAAPELLAALKGLVEAFGHNGGYIETVEFRTARAAIAKAEALRQSARQP